MILQSLSEYYQRNKSALPVFGRELKEIDFIIVIDKDGQFIRFEDRRINKSQAQKFLVKKSVVDRTRTPIANFLYDDSSYVLGYSEKNDATKHFKTFKKKVTEIQQKLTDNEEINALSIFYKKEPEAILEIVKQDPLWEEIVKNLKKKYSLFSFLLQGNDRIVAERDELIDSLCDETGSDEKICLISGKKSKVVKTTTATMIPESLPKAKLVAFQENSGYDSYGKEKGMNAPISQESEFAYTTALNHMLASDSRNKYYIGDRTFLFWSSNNNDACRQVEESIFSLFGFQDQDDDPNRRIQQVRKVFSSIYSGVLKTSLDDRFYILGLAPNRARISVIYWADIQLKEFASVILRHFNDMEIVATRKEKKSYTSLRSILSAVTQGGNPSDATPNLPDSIIKSIFQGTSYPYTLFASCIRRIRAEQNIGITRAAIIKAYLNRINNTNQIKVMLDKDNPNQGYLCGRLFAVLDKIQGDANSQHSIRERYMNAASSTPAAVFSTILNLSAHHSEKLSEGSKIFYEKLKQEIINKISADGFPTHLDLQDQGRFFVGFYHQQQDFFLKNSQQIEK